MDSSAEGDSRPALAQLGRWTSRQWAVAAGAALGFLLLVAIPTDLIDTPVFGREVAPTWWAWPALLVSSALAGLLTATYVRTGEQAEPEPASRSGLAGGVLTFFAVGCPVCNKLVLLALGSAGAMTWFEPVQPLVQVLAVGLLLWALRMRLRTAASCRVSAPPTTVLG